MADYSTLSKNRPSKDQLFSLIKSVKNEAYQYPLLYAWEKYKYGAHWDFWEEGHSMFEYMIFEGRIADYLPKLIQALEVQKEYFHPKYKEILAVYSKLKEDLDDGIINV